MPEHFQWADFDDPRLRERIGLALVGKDLRDPVDIVRFAPSRPPNILLMGPSESGKTSLAAACLRHIVKAAFAEIETGGPLYRRGVGVRFTIAYDIAKAQIYSRLGERPQIVEQACAASVLVIDELGMDTEVYRESATSVREVIHERQRRHRPTIITTYLSKDDLQRHYGKGIANRLSKFKVVTLRKKS